MNRNKSRRRAIIERIVEAQRWTLSGFRRSAVAAELAEQDARKSMDWLLEPYPEGWTDHNKAKVAVKPSTE